MTHLRARSTFARLLRAAVAALLITSGWPVSATRGADDSNIPGVPLPGPVVTGRLGGPIYDRVYSIDLLPDDYLLLSLTGERGTDFDLYLFDASATSVYSTVGQVAASTGDSSSESISYGSHAGGRFYIDLNGASEVEGAFRLTMRIAPDTLPPQLELVLDGGATATNDAAVRGTLVATDDLSGVTAMQLSPDGQAWFPWRPYTPSILWTFDSVDGPKALWARVRDNSGNVSAVATASITLDTVAPTIVSLDPGPGQTSVTREPTFRATFSEPIDPRSWLDNGIFVQDPGGTTIRGTYTLDAPALSGSFKPSVPLVAGLGYVVSLGAVRDLAGNPVVPVGSWVVQPLTSHSISLQATPTVVSSGATAQLFGRIDPTAYGSLVIEKESVGGAWEAISSATANNQGEFAITYRALTNASLRVHLLRTSTDAESYSPALRVLARRLVALSGSLPATTRTATRGSVVRLAAVLGPAAPDATVTLTVSQLDPRTHLYRTATRLTSVSRGGRAAFEWRPGRAGSYRVRVTTPPTALFANATSPSYRFVVK